MTDRITTIVEALTDEERIQLIKDYEILCREGAIDTCALRTLAAEVSLFGFDVMNMVLIANACHAYYSKIYLKSIGVELS